METKYGVIVNKVNERGFGFIRPDDEAVNVFFHASGVFQPKFEEMKLGDKVEYLVNDTEKGPRAFDVTAIKLVN